jgi:hypothetical protein
MPITYESCDGVVGTVIERIVNKEHGEFASCEPPVTIAALWARNSDKTQPAVKLHGYPCRATIRKTNSKERANGSADLMIVIDEAVWDSLDSGSRDGLISHEIEHVELLMKGNRAKIGHDGRPALRLKPHDYELGGFLDVIRRHGDNSLEYQDAKTFATDQRQLLFGWMGEQKQLGNGNKK